MGHAYFPLSCKEAAEYYREACSVSFEVPVVVRAADLYCWAFCMAEVDQLQFADQIQQILNRTFQLLCQSLPVRGVRVKAVGDSEAFEKRAPSFFRLPQQTPNQVFFDCLMLQVKVYGMQQPERAESCLHILLESATEARDADAVRAALRSFQILYANLGNQKGAQWAAEQLAAVDAE